MRVLQGTSPGWFSGLGFSSFSMTAFLWRANSHEEKVAPIFLILFPEDETDPQIRGEGIIEVLTISWALMMLQVEGFSWIMHLILPIPSSVEIECFPFDRWENWVLGSVRNLSKVALLGRSNMNWKPRGLKCSPVNSDWMWQAFLSSGPQFPHHKSHSTYAALTLCRTLGFSCFVTFNFLSHPVGATLLYLHSVDENTQA